MDEKQIELKLNDHDHEIGSLKERVSTCEERQGTIYDLASSVKELSINMKYMLEEQRRQGTRLEALEQAPTEEAKYIRRQVIAAVIAGVVGTIVGALISLIITKG
ncbi:MAG: hypothetical protein J6S14_08235 [Clostridia bacterium]|nr:hypothetical protein [Clostridia bacterium]